MDLLKTGIGISKTIKNVGRLKEIVSVFTKHGFASFISMGTLSKIPDFAIPQNVKDITDELEGVSDRSQIIGKRLSACFEELGPAYVKFGQLLSSREDIFPESFIEEMQVLRDKVAPVSFSDLKKRYEDKWPSDLEKNFEYILEEPIGMASIGLVYKGKLKSGDEVVIKIRRPNIVSILETDLEIISFLATQLEKISEDIKFLGLTRIAQDFSAGLVNELNFNIEALNADRFKRLIEKYDTKKILKIPEIYKDFSSEKIIVMEMITGTPFTQKEKLQQNKKELYDVVYQSMTILFEVFFKEGFFHGDLHGGNFFYINKDRIGLIDFGLMGNSSNKGRKSLMAIIYSMINFDYENLTYEFLDVAEYEQMPNIDLLVNDMRVTLAPYVGLLPSQINFSLILKSVISALRKHEVFLPREWFLLFRSLMTMDGVGRSLNLDLDLHEMMEKDMKSILRSSLNANELMEDLGWAAKDLSVLGRILPRHIKWFLKDFSKKGYSLDINIDSHEKSLEQISRSLVFLGLSLIAAVLVYFSLPLILEQSSRHELLRDFFPWICLVGAATLLLGAFRRIFK